ncbi:NAD(P)-dependent dehydrogenase (short-subunit alcohol dehydrogenase family) [Microbacterium sp. BE35]|uniref:SDR family oxidoreductase n=1 Tax=Microbacterium sp. BE35 TaxID=2817773 RepID=UPI00285B029B|nr:SDR family oxidoreductase [Microbacterium sp. BE35]MDR7188179.1 NAD(P)-dependent dehydrogenase (short-subunit alcohol dehydrogenase family) [Microbacterium sp. BE35]
MTELTLSGETVLVTGSNGGLGVEFVTQALERGASKVYATARTPRDWADDRVVPLALDVLDQASIEHAVATASDVTVVVNNAGIYPLKDSLLHGTQAEFRQIFDTNFFGAVEIVRAFAPGLAARGGGAIINVHSALSWRSSAHGAYSASKAALWSATNALRVELADQDVHVLGLFMSWVDTPMVAHETEVQKASPREIVGATYDGLERRDYEVLGDDDTRWIRETLSEPIEAMYSELVRD